MDHPQSADRPPPPRMFTPKAVAAGLLGVLWIAVGAGWVDDILKTPNFVVGNFFPVGATTYLLALVLVWNPLFAGLLARPFPRARRAAFRAPELALVLGMTLIACFAPTSGLYRFFHRQQIIAWVRADAAMPTWRQALDTIPENLWPDGVHGVDAAEGTPERAEFHRVYTGFLYGLPEMENQGWRGLFAWPWEAWAGMMRYWGPLLACFAAAVIALVWTVHRQWVRHEQLAYPLGQIYGELLAAPADGQGVLPMVFRRRLFWWAFAAVFLFHGWNYVGLWFPDLMPAMPTGWHLPISQLFTGLEHSGALWGSRNFTNGSLTFAIIGVAYFLSSEVGFTLGISQLLVGLACAQTYLMIGRPITWEEMEAQRLGAYVGYALILLYAGRHWYARIARKAFGFGRPDEVDAESVWAARCFVLSAAAMFGVLCAMGMAPWLAGCYLVFLFTLLLVLARIVGETGMPFLQIGETIWVPFLRLLGASATGVRGVTLVGHVNSSIGLDHSVALSPFAANALYVGQRVGARMPRFVPVLAGAAVLALAVAFWARGYGYYAHGANDDRYAVQTLPGRLIAEPLRVAQRLASEQSAWTDALPSDGGGVLRIRPEKGTWIPFSIVLAALVAVAALRFRFRGFPLHPVLFVVWGTYPMSVTAHCFLMGWAIKSLVMHFGGGQVYQKGKPFFIGLITGEAVVLVVSMGVGLVYARATGEPPLMPRLYP